jgi:hypothetical protein
MVEVVSAEQGGITSLLVVACCRKLMDAKVIVFGETAIDRLLQWLRSTGQPQDITNLVRQYLEILSKAVREENE